MPKSTDAKRCAVQELAKEVAEVRRQFKREAVPKARDVEKYCQEIAAKRDREKGE